MSEEDQAKWRGVLGPRKWTASANQRASEIEVLLEELEKKAQSVDGILAMLGIRLLARMMLLQAEDH